MTLHFATTHAPAGPTELNGLVDAIRSADPNDETVWLEWKHLDLTQRDALGGLAKAILGMANRQPAMAAGYCEGRGYVVIGASPEDGAAVTKMDSADLANKLEPFLGPGVRWQPHWIDQPDGTVLVVEIGAPRVGDPPFPIRRGTDRIREGTVFIRRPGKTEPASASEIDQLVHRARARPHLHGLRVTASGLIQPVDFADQARHDWLEQERAACLQSLEQHRRAGDAAHSPGPLAPAFAMLLQAKGEQRSPEQYIVEVNAYLATLAAVLPRHLEALAAMRFSNVTFTVHNDTDDNYTQVAVDVHLAGPITAVQPAERLPTDARLPRPPRPYGPYVQNPFAAATFLPDIPVPSMYLPPGQWVDIVNSESATLRFRPEDLRPREQLDLAAVILFGEFPPGGVRASWTATSTSVSGVARGSVPLAVAGKPVSVGELLAEEEASDEPE